MVDEPDLGPVVQRLILGERLRSLRESSTRLGVDDANAEFGWYRGKLSKIEGGTLGITERELSTLLARYGISGPAAAQVRQLGIEARRRAAPERVSDWAKQYVPLERAATEIRMCDSEIPGLLQTRDYARAQLLGSPVVTAADVEPMADARAVRGQRLYRDNAPRVWAVLGEEALLRRVGTPEQMTTQLRHLREVAELPAVSIRVVPLHAGAYAGLSCPFTLLWIEAARATIAYVETMTGADYVKTVGTYNLAFERAEAAALSERDTLDLLEHHIDRAEAR
ncbi:DUF5753 domain-containing protein [Saccharopolyspora cebuensis]|uniref:DUF5753 domain-containing protein n=1 Tax=Saccharopolyspora cebuensis TaxID=418759 RepID=A0ABV4CIT2_9PSEU